MSNKKSTSSELQGLTRLITDATIGITDLVEDMHRRVVHPPFLPSTPIQNLITKIAGLTFQSIRWTTELVGSGTDKALGQLASVLGEARSTDQKEVIRAVLNGVIGDHLEESDNPLKIDMQFRNQGKTVLLDSDSIKKAYPQVNGKIILMVHGSCMSDIQWTRNEHNHGIALAKELDMTPIYLHYNSGRHISTNGQEFSEKLEALVKQWPVPVEELTILSHSMGGLVSRSALHYGYELEASWTKYLTKIVFLGTPHHGAPLEKAGNMLDIVLEAIPYAKPFARLGKIRSAGVKDLRYGNLLDEDWEGKDLSIIEGDQRTHVPLPDGVSCYSIAGISGKEKKSKAALVIGDKMVGVKSALGQHEDSSKDLSFKKENTWITYETNHLDLLSDAKVYAKLKLWLG